MGEELALHAIDFHLVGDVADVEQPTDRRGIAIDAEQFEDRAAWEAEGEELSLLAGWRFAMADFGGDEARVEAGPLLGRFGELAQTGVEGR
jgi:hypothetical protein